MGASKNEEKAAVIGIIVRDNFVAGGVNREIAEQFSMVAQQAAMKMAELKDEQYLSADFIGKVLRMADTYTDKRSQAAIVKSIVNELKMEK